ncbi:MAG: MATE family efflux transporter [Burkholderiaceae bacterium]
MRQHASRIALLAWPILLGQLAVIANGVIDTAMTARYSSTDLAALAVGSSIYVSIFVGLNGVLQALSPIIGQLFGAKRYAEIGWEVKQGFWLAALLTGIGSLILFFPQPLLSLADASPDIQEKVTLYLRTLMLALPASLGFRVYASVNTAIARPKMVMAIQIGALALKVPLNSLFIFGGFGIPAFGGPGCAIATAITTWLSFLLGFALLRTLSSYKQFGVFGSGFIKPNWKAQAALLKLGIPIGLSYLIEVTAYTFMALFIARLGDTAVAGHQVTANFGTVLYMLPLSIASATGVLAAQAIGAREMTTARQIGNTGILLAAVLSAATGLVIWQAREWIVRAYTPDPAVIQVALPLFLFIAFYQLFDAIQVTTAFVLRAYRVAVVPTIMYALALWGIGLGGGYMLGLDPFQLSVAQSLRGPAGFWMANSASLALVGLALVFYLRRVQHKAGLVINTGNNK